MIKPIVKFLSYSQEIILALYLFPWIFIIFFNFSTLNELKPFLLFSGFFYSMLMLIILLIKNKHYFSFLYFRLGFTFVLMLWMFIKNNVCTLCLRAHIIIIIFSLTIIVLTKNHRGIMFSKTQIDSI